MKRRPTFEQVQARRRERAAARVLREQLAEDELSRRQGWDIPVLRPHPLLSGRVWSPFL